MNVIDVLTAPWAIMPSKLEEITGIYSTHLRSGAVDIGAIEAKAGKPLDNSAQGYDIVDGAAVISVEGVIAKRMNLFTQISGGVSTQLIARDFKQAVTDSSVKAIILLVDSPGGAVDGTAELAKAIFETRGQKPIYALVDGLMASAAVWIGSAADRVFISSRTAMVGSIGVLTQHVDYSERNKKAGINVTEIYAGRYKRIASEQKPLTEEGQAYIQGQLDYLYSIFVDTVAQHRGTTSDDVLNRMADGRMFVGQQAIDAGLVDGFSTLSQLIGRLSTPGGAPKIAAVESTPPTLREQWNSSDNLRGELGIFERFKAYSNRNRARK